MVLKDESISSVMKRSETTLEEECRELRESIRGSMDYEPDPAAEAACAYLLNHLASMAAELHAL
jgi:hypothetical protein